MVRLNPVRPWFIAALGLALLVLLAGGLWFYHSQEHQLQQQANDELQAIADLKAGQIAAWRAEQLADAAVLAENPLFVDGVTRWMANPQPEQSDEIRSTLQALQTHYHYYDAFLVDADGQVRLSLSGQRDPLHEEAAQVLAAAWRSRQPALTDLHVGSGDLPPHIDVVAPLFTGSEPDSAPIGAVIVQLEAGEFLYPLIQSWPTPSASAETLLVRRDGDSVLFLNELRHQNNTALTLRIPLSQTDVPAVLAVLGRRGVMRGTDYRGVRVLSVLEAIPDSSWLMVAKVDEAEILADWHSRARLIVALALGLLAAIGMFGGAIWQRVQKGHYRTLLQAEKARIESEARYRTTLLSIGDGILTADAAGRTALINPVAEALTGWSQEEARGKPLEEVFHIVNEDTRQPVENPVRRVIREGVIVGLSNHTLLIARDGTERPIADSGAPILDTDGHLIGVVLVFRDQTGERAVQKALQENERRYRLLFENMTSGFALHEMIFDEQGQPTDYRFLEINPAFEQLTGLVAADLIGKTVKEALPNTEPYWIEVYGRVVQTGEPTAYENYSQELGRYYDVWAFRPDQGQFAVIITDVTERTQVEQALRESEERYRSIINNLPNGLVHILDRDFRYVFTGGEGMRKLGISNEMLAGKRIQDVLDPDMAKLAEQHYRRVLDGETVRFEGGYANQVFLVSAAA